MEFYRFRPQMILNLYVFSHHLEINQQSRKLVSSDVVRKTSPMQNWKERRSWKIKKCSGESHGIVMENYFIKSVGTLQYAGPCLLCDKSVIVLIFNINFVL